LQRIKFWARTFFRSALFRRFCKYRGISIRWRNAPSPPGHVHRTRSSKVGQVRPCSTAIVHNVPRTGAYPFRVALVHC
jgi:hypothetical protein